MSLTRHHIYITIRLQQPREQRPTPSSLIRSVICLYRTLTHQYRLITYRSQVINLLSAQQPKYVNLFIIYLSSYCIKLERFILGGQLPGSQSLVDPRHDFEGGPPPKRLRDTWPT